MRIKTNNNCTIFIELPTDDYVSYKQDCRLITTLCMKHNITITTNEADYLWSEISDKYYCAGWMIFDKDNMEYVWIDICRYLREIFNKTIDDKENSYGSN